MNKVQQHINKKLEERILSGNLRQLSKFDCLIDFCSNDYLGFARSSILKNTITNELAHISIISNGSTGSRLLSGNSEYAENLEKTIASMYHCDAGLIYSTGYTANLGLFSALPEKGDTIIMDELIHASIIDGARLSFANRFKFKHNDLKSLEDKLKKSTGICYVVIEGVYSMDGDSPNIEAILTLTEKYQANLIIDEAHSIGLYGLGLVNNLISNRIFARIITFGKALGGHGAIILGSKSLINFLINFSRPFIYTTAPPLHQLVGINMAFQLLLQSENEILNLKKNIAFFKSNILTNEYFPILRSDSAIQCLILKSNNLAKDLSVKLQLLGMDVRPVLSPTVANGSERIRICLHSYNSNTEIELLTNTINSFINGR